MLGLLLTAGESRVRGLTLCLVDVDVVVVTGPTGISTSNPCTLFLGLMMMMMMANESIIHPTEPNDFLKNSLADTSFHPHQNTLSFHETSLDIICWMDALFISLS
jgi:hypothetical protein